MKKRRKGLTYVWPEFHKLKEEITQQNKTADHENQRFNDLHPHHLQGHKTSRLKSGFRLFAKYHITQRGEKGKYSLLRTPLGLHHIYAISPTGMHELLEIVHDVLRISKVRKQTW